MPEHHESRRWITRATFPRRSDPQPFGAPRQSALAVTHGNQLCRGYGFAPMEGRPQMKDFSLHNMRKIESPFTANDDDVLNRGVNRFCACCNRIVPIRRVFIQRNRLGPRSSGREFGFNCKAPGQGAPNGDAMNINRISTITPIAPVALICLSPHQHRSAATDLFRSSLLPQYLLQ